MKIGECDKIVIVSIASKDVDYKIFKKRADDINVLNHAFSTMKKARKYYSQIMRGALGDTKSWIVKITILEIDRREIK